MNAIKPRLMGAMFGALFGISWLIWGWRFLWVLVPVGIGYGLGWCIENRGGIREKLREVAEVMSR